MLLYRIRDVSTGLYYRHRYSQFRGGDWVEEKVATIWTKPGGVNGALGAVRKKFRSAKPVVEKATINPKHLEWLIY